MAASPSDREKFTNELKTKLICRFCLTQQPEKLGSIYSRDARLRASAPLTVQIMACASIEVFSNDGMPSWICSDCRVLFEHGYRFKQMCKRADTSLRQVPLTCKWPLPLNKPKFPFDLQRQSNTRAEIRTSSPTITSAPTPAPPVPVPAPILAPVSAPVPIVVKKLLNANPVASPEPPIPVRMKKEKFDDETTNILNKVENEEVLSLDDVHRLMAAGGDEEEFITCDNDMPPPPVPVKKPKLLNKSSIRILNKDAGKDIEPRLSTPQLKRDEDGNMAMVTEILDPNEPFEAEPDPIKNAVPVETNVFPCPHCERTFPLRQLRDIHMVNHNRERSFHCGECDKSFFSKYDLQKHNLIHTGDRPFKCTVCERAFTRATLLRRHEKSHTDIPKFICVFCEKPFISKEEMEKHTERHRKNRPYQCKICNKSFAFKQGLERHEVVHSRDQPYPCQYCEHSFSTPSKLARHLTAHAGKRPYPCKFCPRSYLLSHHLTRHLRSHKQGKVSFMCNNCDKEYKTRDELIYHSAVHATQTLVCPLCKENFSNIESVTAHIKEHADGEAYACEFCDLIFMTSTQLQAHIDSDHAEEMMAYHEDDKKAKKQNEKKQKKEKKEAQLDDNDLQQTIEEFLVDELPEDTEFLDSEDINIVAQGKSIIKMEDEEPVTKQPQILNHVVLMPSNNNVETTEADLLSGEEDTNDPPYQPPAKYQKVILNSKQGLGKATAKAAIQTSLRRKSTYHINSPNDKSQLEIVSNETSATPSAKKIIQPTINSVLKSLPKSVSVRRNVAGSSASSKFSQSITPEKATESHQTSPQKHVVRFISTRANTIATTESEKTQPERNQVTIKRSPVNKSASQTRAGNSGSAITKQIAEENVEKMTVGDKKMKVQKITITKMEAAALEREGRLSYKDGKMILTKNSTKK